jgi:hypothetical protein
VQALTVLEDNHPANGAVNVVSTAFSIVTRGGHPDFLDLPWSEPLSQWEHPRLIAMARGVSRHVVRFLSYDGRVYAAKETTAELAEREFRSLRALAQEGLPVVEAVGVVTGRTTVGDGDGETPDAALITRYLDFSLPYRYVLAGSSTSELRETLLSAGAVLLVRLHLEGVFWGDCSLSNVLFRRDAGALMAYLVDAETVEHHPPPLADPLRDHDLEIAAENIVGGLLDLQEGGLLTVPLDPVEVVEELLDRYHGLWAELTRTDEVGPHERHLIDERVRRLNELGFDVEELRIETTPDGDRVRIRPVLVEEGHHFRELRRRTGLEVQENQARRLLNDIAGFRAWLERQEGAPISEATASARWLAEVYEPIVEQVPVELQGRLEPAELFHELLEHRWLLGEAEGREVSNEEALRSLLSEVLPERPEERTILTSLDDDG